MQRIAPSGIISKKVAEFYWTATRALGLEKIHGKEREVFARALNQAATAWLYPIFLVIAGFIKLSRWRFIEAPPFALSAIGHLALDFDCFFKEQILDGKNYKYILVGDTNCPIANRALFNMWASRMIVVKNKFALRLAKRLLFWFPTLGEPIIDYCHQIRGAARAHLAQKRWGQRGPLLKLSETDITRGAARLREMGIPPGAWFVCVHCREAGYAPEKEWANSYRNCDISSFIPAMELIVARGGWCIRMGDATMKPLPAMDRVIDYALSEFREDWMDLFLCSECRFVLGTSSGLFNVAGVFGKSSALANHAPISSISAFPLDLNISKLFEDENGRTIPFDELFASEASEYRYTYEFENAKIRVVDNTPEEIVELTVEMLKRLDSGLPTPPDNEMQAAFRSLAQPHHFGWHTASQMATSFLNRHRNLLPMGVAWDGRQSEMSSPGASGTFATLVKAERDQRR